MLDHEVKSLFWGCHPRKSSLLPIFQYFLLDYVNHQKVAPGYTKKQSFVYVKIIPLFRGHAGSLGVFFS